MKNSLWGHKSDNRDVLMLTFEMEKTVGIKVKLRRSDGDYESDKRAKRDDGVNGHCSGVSLFLDELFPAQRGNIIWVDSRRRGFVTDVGKIILSLMIKLRLEG